MPFWESSAFWGIAGIVVGFLGSTIYYFVGKERYSMKHQITTKQIVTKEITNIPEVKVSFDDRVIEELTESTIKFVNSGNQIITPHDYAAKEPLGVHISGHLYKYSTSAENSNSVPEIKPFGKNKYKIEFDFLKPKQSFSIVMFHDGNITIFGDLIEGRGFGTDIGVLYCIVDHRMYKRSALAWKIKKALKFVGVFTAIITAGYFLFTIRPLLFATGGIIFGAFCGYISVSIKKTKARRAYIKRMIDKWKDEES